MNELISKFLETIANGISRHRLLYIIIALIVTAALIYPLSNLRFTTDMDVFSPDRPEVVAKRYVEENFISERTILVIAVPISGRTNDAAFLADVLETEGRLRGGADIERTFSVATYVEMALNMSGSSLSATTQQMLDLLLDEASADRDISGLFTSKAALILVTPGDPLDENRIATFLRENARDTEETEYHVLAGFDNDMDDGARRSLYLFPVSLAFIIAVLYLSLRRWFDVVLVVCAIPVVLIWTFGISVLLGLPVTILGAAVPFIVLALGIDYAIHSMNRYTEEKAKGSNGEEAARLTIKHLGVALLLSSITTVAAYISNAASSIPAVVDFGIMVGIGIACSFFVMGLMLPVVRSLFGRNAIRKERKDPLEGIWKKLSRRLGRSFDLRRNAAIILAGTLVITVGAGYMALQLDSEFEPDDVLPHDSKWLVAEKALTENFPRSLNTYQVLVT